MATNNIKAFATGEGANVLNDTELASRSELQTGFPFKSKADSKLVGKLMQNATAGAYAVGEFSAKYGTQDVSGSDATGFATAFESALQAYVNEKAPSPDLSGYLTTANASATYLSKTDAQSTYQPKGDYATTSVLATKADASALANYAPIANPAFTGTATLGGKNLVTIDQIPDTSAFITNTPSANLSTVPAGITIDSEKQLAGISVAADASTVRVSEENAEIFGGSGVEIFGGSGIVIASPDIRIGHDRNQALLSIVQGTITTHNLQDESVINNLSERLILAEGSRGNLAGYENITVRSSAIITINQDSPDSQQLTSAEAITVSNGSANQSYVKKVSIKNASATISLGSSWSWAGGSQPTVTAPSLLVLSWDNDCGIAILQTTGS